eukprot:TRINITY_DN2587_c0_g1_i2.p1 TRINITY_DN2587_c0_g1~~TRINITY_DN2587_c0_g1_i2.p1  ORF type:complete len:221 (-),score=46.08 TRINITY_DN2587_c0_g1_i2:110-772(-)
MIKLFGRPKPEVTPRESIQRLRDTLTMLEKREEYLEKKIHKERLFAKQNATKNKRAAIMALKRMKAYETQIERLSGARMTIETQVMALEGATVSLEAMNAMRMGASAMRTIHRNMNINDVDNTMEEIREQMDLVNEINDAIAQPIGGEIYDEDELESELAALAEENLDEEFLGIKTPASSSQLRMPDAPQTSLPQVTAAKEVEDDSKDLEALEKSMTLAT